MSSSSVPEQIVRVSPAEAPLRGNAVVPGDKSIAHRAVLFSAAASGSAKITGLPSGHDVLSSLAAVERLGARVQRLAEPGSVQIEGCGLRFTEPTSPIDCGNSGTTIRLLMGLLAGSGIRVVLDGDSSLRRRPMARVADPLITMGASIHTDSGRAPVRIEPAALTGTAHELTVASAQIKSALLLAGLSANGITQVTEPLLSRDHTERMLAAMDVVVGGKGRARSVEGPVVPNAVDVIIPGDPSSAAFLCVAALLVPGSDLTIDGICLNPTRIGFLEILRSMGANLEVTETSRCAGEAVGSIRARGSQLRPFSITAADVPAAIDELPILAVAAAAAGGTSRLRGAKELRVKESDRIATVAAMLGALGATVTEYDDGMDIVGAPNALAGGASVEAAGDHRLAMSAAVAALVCRESVEIRGAEAAAVSFPGFFELLENLRT